MAIVTDIHEFRGLMEISLDGVLWLRLRKKHLSLLPLEVGDAVDPERYIDRQASIQAAECYEAALSMLDQAAQTGNGIIVKLKRRGFVEPAAEATVARLRENRLIDDRRYAERAAQTHLSKPVGAFAVRRKLRAKHLQEDDIEAAMECFDEEQQLQACRAAAERLWRKYSELPSREGRAKLAQALARRGFAWDAIRSVTDALGAEDEFD